MRLLTIVPRLLAPVVLFCASAEAVAQQNPVTEFGTPKFEGKQTVGSGAVAIEATMLASTAVDAAAAKIAEHVEQIEQRRSGHHVLVIGGTESVDFGQVAMIQTEMSAIQEQLKRAMASPSSDRSMSASAAASMATIIPALAGMMRSDVEYSAVEVSLDSRVLPSAVAAKLRTNVTLFSALAGATNKSKLLSDFEALGTLATAAQTLHDTLAEPKNQSDQDKRMIARLAAALKRYDTFFTRVTTATDKGVVPLAVAARLAQIIEKKPLLLRVNSEKIGGTTVKRTNLLTFFGADGLSISGGLVASYQLTEPESGLVTAAGLVTCRTTLTKLKSVQDSTWKARGSYTDEPKPLDQAAVCRAIGEPRIAVNSGAANGTQAKE